MMVLRYDVIYEHSTPFLLRFLPSFASSTAFHFLDSFDILGDGTGLYISTGKEPRSQPCMEFPVWSGCDGRWGRASHGKPVYKRE